MVAIVNSSHRVRPGDIVDLILPLDKLHLFDAETGAALTPTNPPAASPAPEVSTGPMRHRRLPLGGRHGDAETAAATPPETATLS